MKALDSVQRSVNITKTQICVDSVQDGEPSGFLYNPYMPERIAFWGYLSLINVMDRFFDWMQCPQAYYQYRAWQAKKSDQRQPEKEVTQFMAEEALHSKNGEKATFTIQVQFRQNATWQGHIDWLDAGERTFFQSALEFIRQVDCRLVRCDTDGLSEQIAQ